MGENPTNAKEQYELGMAYLCGEGRPKDERKGISLLTQAAEQDVADAMFWLARRYDLVPDAKDWFDKAVKQYTKDAKGGDAKALFNLGQLYYSPGMTFLGTDIAKRNAFTCTVDAAKQGCVEAQLEVGGLCRMGSSHLGFSKDLESAVYWLSKATEQGNDKARGELAGAMYDLGICSYYGDGVPKDAKKARECIAHAAAHGIVGAKEALENINAGKPPKPPEKKSGCYVATCVYGSYDCPQVWTLRRYRDARLSTSWFGRLFIRIYYAASPKAVELFGGRKWFTGLCKPVIDRIVRRLQNNGISGDPYSDA